jgi:hypothetical protein
VSAQDVIAQIKALPKGERDHVVRFVIENEDSWIPESFKEGIADAEAGFFAGMETVLRGTPPPPRPVK